jgi:hypothetical protein
MGEIVRRIIAIERRMSVGETWEPSSNGDTVDLLHAYPSTPHPGAAITGAHVTATDSTGALVLQATGADIASQLTLDGGTAKQYSATKHDRMLMRRLVTGTTLADVASINWGRETNRRMLVFSVVSAADALTERVLFGEDGGILLGNMAVTRVGAPGDAVHIGGTGQPISASRQQLNILEYTTTPGAGTGGGVCFKGSFTAGAPGTMVEYAAIVGKRETDASSIYGYIGFGTRGSDGSAVAERARITYQGHLLIGTTTDDVYHLDVAGDARFTGTVVASALTLGVQAANTGFMGPAAGAPAVPTFRALVAADVPDLTQYLLLAGRAGGQVAYGGTAANDDLTLEGTSNATKTTSYVILQPTGGYVGIGTTAPEIPLHVRWSTADGEMQTMFGAGGIRQRNAGDAATDPTPFFTFQRGRGTLASPTTIQSGNGLFAFQSGGYDGTAWRSGWNGGIQFMGYATENWTSTAHGAEMWFYTTATGAATPSLRMKITQAGDVSLHTPSATPTAIADVTRIYSADQAVEAGNAGLHVLGESTSLLSWGNRLILTRNDAGTNTVANVLTLAHNTSGTAAAGFGAGQLFTLESSTTADQSAGLIETLWATATHASRAARMVLSVYDTAAREGLRIEASGTAPMLGFYGHAAAAQAAAIAAADGTLASATAQLNSLLAAARAVGLIAT